MAQAMAALKQIHPGARTLSIISSTNPSSQLITDQVEIELRKPHYLRSKKIELKRVLRLRMWEDWKREMVKAGREVDALLVLVPYDVRDTNNVEVSLHQIGNWINRNLSIPTIGIISAHVKMGGLFALSVSPYRLGTKTGQVAAEILNSKEQKSFGFTPFVDHVLEINTASVRKFGLQVPSKLVEKAEFYHGIDLPYGR